MKLRGGKKIGLKGDEQGDTVDVESDKEVDEENLEGAEGTSTTIETETTIFERKIKEDRMMKMLEDMMVNMNKMGKNINKMEGNMNKMGGNMNKMEENMIGKMDEMKQENKEEIKKELQNIGDKIKEVTQNLKDYTDGKIEETRNEIRREMIERITEVEELNEQKIRVLENKTEDTDKENKRIDRRVMINSKNISDLEKNLQKNISENMKMAEQEIVKTRTELNTSYRTLERQMKEGFKLQEEVNTLENNNTNIRINKIEHELKQGLTGIVGEQRIQMIYNKEQSMKFEGDANKLHPKIFLQMLKNKIKNIQNMDDIKEIIHANLEGQALLWYNSIVLDINNYEYFEQSFLKYFWGENTQSFVRENLYFGKFDYCRSSNMNYYALRLFTLAKYLDPPMNEEEIVMSIARHYKAEVAETIALQNINKFEQFSSYLLRIERGLLHRNYNNTNNTYTNNYNNNRLHNNSNDNNYNNRDTNNRKFNNAYRQTNNYNNENYRNHNTHRNNRFNNNYNTRFNNNNNYYNRNNNNNRFNRYNSNNKDNNNGNYERYNNNDRTFNNNNDNNRQDSQNAQDYEDRQRRVNFQQTVRRPRSLEREFRREGERQEGNEHEIEVRRTTSLDRSTYVNDQQNF